jgi:glycosyltransferase involved in cell wall biosynthesis
MISMVVPAFNASATLDLCLDALAHQTVAADSYEVLVVDDGSSDDTPSRGAGKSSSLPTRIVRRHAIGSSG